MNERITELQDIIRKATAEMEDIRSKCQHPSHYVGMWMWRIGSIYPTWICNECGNAISGITPEEEKKAWDEYNNPKVDGREFRSGTSVTLVNNGNPDYVICTGVGKNGARKS